MGEQTRPGDGAPEDGGGTPRHLRDARDDGLQPLKPLDPEAVSSCDELLEAMRHTAFGGASSARPRTSSTA